MQLTLLSLFVASALASPVQKRQNVSPTDLPSCALGCFASTTLPQGCTLLDTSCLCTNNAFQQAVTTCIEGACTSPADLQKASSVSQQLCLQAGVTITPPPVGGMSSTMSMAGSSTMMMSSADTTATMSSMAASAMPSSSMGSMYPAFPCPNNSELVYAEAQTNVNARLPQVNEAVSFFSNSTLFNITTASGGMDAVGETREIQFFNTTVPEVLIDFMMNNETNARYLTWNSTEEATILNVRIPKYTTESQTYINDTQTYESNPVSTIKLFSNICVGTDMEGEKENAQTFFATYFQQHLEAVALGIEAALTGGVIASASGSGLTLASGAMASATSSA